MTDTSLAFRLNRALRDERLTQVRFSERLEQAGVRGASRKSVGNYLKGDGEPTSPEWYSEAARILGVNEPWLREGSGEMRPKPPDAGDGYPAYAQSLYDTVGALLEARSVPPELHMPLQFFFWDLFRAQGPSVLTEEPYQDDWEDRLEEAAQSIRPEHCGQYLQRRLGSLASYRRSETRAESIARWYHALALLYIRELNR
ncbi:MAG: hypothetical protein ACF8Q5_01250 [Phycisphaerales bacterium JB040]